MATSWLKDVFQAFSRERLYELVAYGWLYMLYQPSFYNFESIINATEAR